MEQVILLLVIGLISLVNWMIQKSAEARKKRQEQERIDRGEQSPQTAVSRHYDEEPEAAGDPSENMKRLMEALGLPLEEEPPKPVPRQQTTPPPLPSQPREMMQPPPLVRTVREMEERGEMPVHRQSPPSPVVAAPPKRATLHDWQRKAAKSLEASSVAEASRAVKPSRARQMLQQPESIRDAVILAEILGKPKSLQG